MEIENDLARMLELIGRPAFLVQNGVIVRVNGPASRRMIETGASVNDLLLTGKAEYEAMTDGWLFLSIRINGVTRPASVTRMEGFDLFLPEEEDNAPLRSFALAGQELRMPLTGMMSAVNRFSAMAEASGDSSLLEQSGSLNRSLFQLMRIVNNMTDAYRYTEDTATRQETMDVCAFLKEKFSACAELLKTQGTALTFSCPAQAVYCLVDAEKLERAVHNIVLNANKFSPPGSPIQAKLTRREDMLYLTVQSVGTGSLDALKEDVFSRYRRAPGMENTGQGIGLGMVLIRATAAAQGGTVLLEQSAEFGTRVTMTMAIRRSASSMTRSPTMKVDYAGEWNHALLEFSEVLPKELYHSEHKE